MYVIILDQRRIAVPWGIICESFKECNYLKDRRILKHSINWWNYLVDYAIDAQVWQVLRPKFLFERTLFSNELWE
jgi:hypothetical protein